MLPITNFVELRVVARRSRTQARRPQAVSEQPMLIHIRLDVPVPRCSVALRSYFQNGMVVARYGRGVTCVNQTRPHCVNQMGKTQSKPLAARRGRGTAWCVWVSFYGIVICVCIIWFDIKKFCVLSSQYIFVLDMGLRTNSDYFYVQN
jgi:hypothetical protein